MFCDNRGSRLGSQASLTAILAEHAIWANYSRHSWTPEPKMVAMTKVHKQCRLHGLCYNIPSEGSHTFIAIESICWAMGVEGQETTSTIWFQFRFVRYRRSNIFMPFLISCLFCVLLEIPNGGGEGPAYQHHFADRQRRCSVQVATMLVSRYRRSTSEPH